jgi:hypothetical protein
LKAYGGQCEVGEKVCTPDLDLVTESIDGEIQDLRCELIESDCKISFYIRHFELTENAIVSLILSEPLSLSSGISLKLETSSSIPDEVSSITDVIWSEKDVFFRGATPSTFSYLMTPSLFKTDSSKWEDDQKGYHISLENQPTHGSQVDISK